MKKKIYHGRSHNWPPKVLIYTDGASRGNPGPASLGFVVYGPKKNSTKWDMSACLYESACLLGQNTNNFAEYSAVFSALKLCVQNKIQKLILKSDSEFLVKQLNGLYKVKSPNIKPLYQDCKKLAQQIPSTKFQHVYREQNKRADELANLILDGANL